jgi:hypothetical protein
MILLQPEYKKVRARGELSRYNYDAQKAGKTFKMNANHVPLRQMNHKKVEQQTRGRNFFFQRSSKWSIEK